jgi:hypothetical protein
MFHIENCGSPFNGTFTLWAQPSTMSLRPPVWFLFSVGLLGLLAVVVTIQGNRLDDRDRRIAADAATHWRVVQRAPEGRSSFVVIDRGSETNREVYDSAVRALCWADHRRGGCPVSFLAEGSSIPAKVFPADAYSKLAFSWGTEMTTFGDIGRPEYTYWNCSEAGEREAPASALCREHR